MRDRADIPDAQSRLTVSPGPRPGGRPASSAMRGHVAVVLAGLICAAEDDVRDARPIHRWVPLEQPLIASAAMSSGRTSLRLPPNEPIGVRTPSTIYASVMLDLRRIAVERWFAFGAEDGASK